MDTDVKTFNLFIRFLSCLFVISGFILHATTSLAETNNVVGVYTNWPTAWIPLNGLNDPNDGLVKSNLEFVGDSTNACGYYASTNGYVFFRQRLQANTTNQSLFADAHFVMINLIGTNYNQGAGEDGKPDYSFTWDSNNSASTSHSLEMQVRGSLGSTWTTSKMEDLDGDMNKKGINDINGDNRTADGFLRLVNNQSTTNFGSTMYIEYAVQWNYLKSYTGLNSNQTWKVTFASLNGQNDHQFISGGDIAGGANPSSPLTNGWTSIMSTPTGSEIPLKPSFFSFF